MEKHLLKDTYGPKPPSTELHAQYEAAYNASPEELGKAAVNNSMNETASGSPKSVLQSARRTLFWDEIESPPEADSHRFLLRVMDLGTWEMIRAMEETYSKEYLRGVVRNATCGALSPMSWNFWCLRLDLDLPYPERFASGSETQNT